MNGGPPCQRRSIPGVPGSGMQLSSSEGMHPYTKHRAFSRLQPPFPLYAECPEKRSVRDISPIGAFLEHANPMPAGQAVQLRIWLGKVKPVVVNATVRWTKPGRGMGVEFVDMGERDREDLGNFLAVIDRGGPQ